MTTFVIFRHPVTILVTDFTNTNQPRESLVNRKDLGTSTLVRLSQENTAPDPLAVLHLNNQLCIWGNPFLLIDWDHIFINSYLFFYGYTVSYEVLPSKDLVAFTQKCQEFISCRKFSEIIHSGNSCKNISGNQLVILKTKTKTKDNLMKFKGTVLNKCIMFTEK